jgi:hypothetical protein
VLYNVPGRTVTDLEDETVVALVNKYPDRIIAIKDASGDLSRVADHRMGIGREFCQLSGNDELWLPHAAAGGRGCISVTANVAPKLCAEFHEAIAANELKKARQLNDRLFPLHYAMFSDASPAPVKYALSRVHGWIEPEVRLPLVEASDEAKRAVDEALVLQRGCWQACSPPKPPRPRPAGVLARPSGSLASIASVIESICAPTRSGWAIAAMWNSASPWCTTGRVAWPMMMPSTGLTISCAASPNRPDTLASTSPLRTGSPDCAPSAPRPRAGPAPTPSGWRAPGCRPR